MRLTIPEKIFFIALRIVFLPIRLLSYLIPTDKNLWLFGAWGGRIYSDNSRALFEYVTRHRPEIRAVWLAHDSQAVQAARGCGGEAWSFWSWRGIACALRASTLIVCCAWQDLPWVAYISANRKRIVQLWHGTSLKRVNLKDGNWLVRLARFAFIAFLGREYDVVVSGSAQNIPFFANRIRFNVPKGSVVVLGQPRNDTLFAERKKSFVHDVGDGARRILYLPTRRYEPTDLFGRYGFAQDEIESVLAQQNATMYIKLHPKDRNLPGLPTASSRIRFILADANANDLLPFFDVLLTDYSSAYFDFLLLDRPVAFLPFDIEHYGRVGQFNYEYEQVTPGPKAKNWPEVADILKSLGKEKDEHVEQRRIVSARFNDYQDDQNCRRVTEHLLR